MKSSKFSFFFLPSMKISSRFFSTSTLLVFGIIGILFISTVLFAVLYGLAQAAKSRDGIDSIISNNRLQVLFLDNNEICLTPYCIKAGNWYFLSFRIDLICCLRIVIADYLIDSIDESVEPCEDFYQFSCGTWLKKNRIPDQSNSNSSLCSLILFIFEIIYRQCTTYI